MANEDAGIVTEAELREAMRLVYESGGKVCEHVVHPNEKGTVYGGERYAVCAQCFEPFILRAKERTR